MILGMIWYIPRGVRRAPFTRWWVTRASDSDVEGESFLIRYMCEKLSKIIGNIIDINICKYILIIMYYYITRGNI